MYQRSLEGRYSSKAGEGEEGSEAVSSHDTPAAKRTRTTTTAQGETDTHAAQQTVCVGLQLVFSVFQLIGQKSSENVHHKFPQTQRDVFKFPVMSDQQHLFIYF